jgi:hypothetical protein
VTPFRQSAAWAAVTAAGALVPFAPAALGVRTLSRHDTERLYAPVRTLVVEELRAGRLPLWNPYEGTGKPLFAEGIHSVLHPVSLLGALLAPASVDFLILGYLVVAAVGAFALGRVLGASAPASAAGGLAYALSGYSVSMTGNLVFLAGAASLPWLVAGARAAGAGLRGSEVWAAAATAVAFFSGDAQAALVGLALGLAAASEAGGTRGGARAGAGMGAGLLLSAIQLLPTRELLPLTQRALELSAAEKTAWALAPWRLAEWIVPGLARGALSAIPAGASGAWLGFPFAESVYLGAPLLVAAALAFGPGADPARRRTALLLGGAAALLLWLALGHQLGARALLDGIPVWNRFRYSEKLMAPLGLCLCALGALGIDAFGRSAPSPRLRRGLAAAALVIAAALAALLAAPDAAARLATDLLGDAGPFHAATLTGGLPHLVLGLAALAGASLLRTERARMLGLALLVAAAPAAATPLGARLSPRRDPSPAPLDREPGAPPPRVVQARSPLFELQESQSWFHEYALHEAALLFPAYNVAARVDALDSYGALEPARLRALRAAGPATYRRFAATHLACPAPRDRSGADRAPPPPFADGGRLAWRDPSGQVELWATPHRPWAFFAERAIATAGPQEATRLLLDLVTRGEDQAVVLEGAAPEGTSPGSVLRVDRGTHAVAVEAESAGPALLVVQDAWWPGWRASIDGNPAQLLPADLLVRAVRWPPGRHRLEMVYEPPALRAGLALSGVGVALTLLLAVRAGRARRAGEPT